MLLRSAFLGAVLAPSVLGHAGAHVAFETLPMGADDNATGCDLLSACLFSGDGYW